METNFNSLIFSKFWFSLFGLSLILIPVHGDSLVINYRFYLLNFVYIYQYCQLDDDLFSGRAIRHGIAIFPQKHSAML